MDDIKRTSEILKLFGISAKKGFSQNFLIDEKAADDIIGCADITGSDLVIEIGPGVGTLTQRLCRTAGYTVAVEVDEDMKAPLSFAMDGCGRYDILYADIMKIDLEGDIIGKYRDEGIKDVKVVANLPYYISGMLMTKLVSESAGISRMALMLQKEVAERVCAGPGSRQYGILSIAVQLYSASRIAFTLKSDSFKPAPKVDSSLVVLDIYGKMPYDISDTGFFFKVVKAAFSQRRKTLVNSLFGGFGGTIPKEALRETVEASGLRTVSRAEEVSLEQFCELSKKVSALF